MLLSTTDCLLKNSSISNACALVAFYIVDREEYFCFDNFLLPYMKTGISSNNNKELSLNSRERLNIAAAYAQH